MMRLLQCHIQWLLITCSHVIVKGPEPWFDEPNVEFIDTQIFIVMDFAAGARNARAQGYNQVGPNALLLVDSVQAGPQNGPVFPGSHRKIMEHAPQSRAPFEKGRSLLGQVHADRLVVEGHEYN